MGRAGLITLDQARAAGLSFDEPEPRACPHCGAALEPLGAALAGNGHKEVPGEHPGLDGIEFTVTNRSARRVLVDGE